MNFLAPVWIPLLAGALAVPSLLLFYFLKLRRREVAVPSTLLWKQAVQDLQVNAPFQRLRSSLLLWLQLLALLIAVLCLWQPVARMTQTEEKTVILLVDQSASMSTKEPDGRTRLEIAKERAKTYVDNLDPRSKAMIIPFSDRARVAAPFTTDKQALRRQIDNVVQTDGASRIGLAIELAEAHGTRQIISSGGADLTPESPTEPAELLLFSDGRIEDAADVVLRRGGMAISRIGEAVDNVGIIGLQARRNYERPEELSVFVTVGNYGPKPVQSDVTLKINGQLQAVCPVTLGAAPAEAAGSTSQPTKQTDAGGPGRSHLGAAPFELTFDGGGVVSIELTRPDALSADNLAWLVVEPPRHLEVLLVSPGNYFLKRVLESLPLRKLTAIDPEAFKAGRERLAPEGRLAFDVAIMDRCSPEDLPIGNYLFFGAAPKLDDVEDTGVVEGKPIYDWDDQHPVLRHVVLNHLRVARWRQLTLPKRAVRLIEGETTPVMAALSSQGSRHLIVAFALQDSNWPLRVSFPVFAYNAIRYLSTSVAGAPAQSLRPGAPVAIPVPVGTSEVKVTPPGTDRQPTMLPAGDRQVVYYQDTQRLGVYRVEPATVGYDAFAVSLLNATESNIRPNDSFAVGTQEVAASKSIRRENRPLWPWLMLAVLGVLLLEWIIYNRRVFV